MPTQQISITLKIDWNRPAASNGQQYKFGDRKSVKADGIWGRKDLLYRWVKNSTGEIAYVGETSRTLMDRVNSYTSAKPQSKAGEANKRVYKEQQSLSKKNVFLYLEFADAALGYNLSLRQERRWAEALVIGVSKPYLQ